MATDPIVTDTAPGTGKRTASGPPLIQIQGICKSFGATRALRDVSLDVYAGRIHALVGENGAGKSTLMKILAGAETPDDGVLLMEGRELRMRRPADALRAGIAMVYQELSLAPHLNVAENVFLGNEPGRFGRFDRREARENVLRLAEECGMDLSPDAIVRDLSTAQCQQVEILRALAHHAHLLILDEPTSSLSETETRRLLDTLKRLVRENPMGVIYISHRIEEIDHVADDLTILRDGAMVYTGPAALTRPEIIRHMVGREMTQVFPPKSERDPGPPMLEASHLCGKGFHDVTFSLAAGEVVGVAGLVGAGRSALADALAGVIPAHSGTVRVFGRALRLRSPHTAIRHGIAYLTEDRRITGLFPHLSVAANMTMAALPGFSRSGFIQTKREMRNTLRMIETLGIKTSAPRARITSLSGGNQQKVLLARWLLTEARILILDEPTRGIDVGAKYDIYVWIDRLAARGFAVLMISSELPELLGVTDRILVMCRGGITATLRTADTTPDEVMHFATAVDDNP